MRHHGAVFFSGLLFALGLGLSGMTDANKVIAFLNLAGDWDPSLAFVMVGAIVVHFVLFRFILRRTSPLFNENFLVPNKSEITSRLVIGGGLFGVGWGLGGFCPGPGIVSGVSLSSHALVFIVAMVAGMVTFQLVDRATARSQSRSMVTDS